MNTGDFEKQLQRQPLRAVPGGWRREILDAARRARGHQLSTSNPQRTSWWRELVWPCPQAWVGLAAVWVVILVLNVASKEPAQAVRTTGAAPGPEVLMALKEQRRLLAELIEPPGPFELPKSFPPRPRSEISPRFATV